MTHLLLWGNAYSQIIRNGKGEVCLLYTSWQRERRKFLESNPFCVKCYEEGHITMATVVDHIVPHRGDQKLFWDRGNWQPLCEHHHNVKTMTEDRYVEYKF